MGHSVFFWKMLEYRYEYSKNKTKRLHCGFGKFASQQYYHTSASDSSKDKYRHVLIWRTFVLDLTDRTHMVLSCTKHKKILADLELFPPVIMQSKLETTKKVILPRANHQESTKRLWINTMKCTLTTLAFTRQILNGMFLTAL